MGLFGKKLTPQEQKYVHSREKVLAKHIDAMNNTDNIQKFFNSYRGAESVLREIGSAVGENTRCIAGYTPKACLESLRRDNVKPIKTLLDRYIKSETVRIMGLSRGRMKAAQGVASIIEVYADDMPKSCAEYAKSLVKAMLEKIEKLEGK